MKEEKALQANIAELAGLVEALKSLASSKPVVAGVLMRSLALQLGDLNSEFQGAIDESR